MRTRDSFGEAMAATWKVCLSEPMRAGDPLVVQDIAEAIRLSATPVREALAWLAGQGLVERRIGRGYFMPCPSAADVGQLYDLHHRYLLWALEQPGARQPDPAPQNADPAERTALLFRNVMTASGNAVLIEAQGRVAARLRLFRRAESQVCLHDPMALAQAEAAFLEGKSAVVRRFIDGHHKAAARKVAEISAATRPLNRNIEQI